NDILLYKKAYSLMIIPFERVKEVVDSRSAFRQKSVDMTQDNLIELICEIYNQPKKDVLGKSRKNEFILPRHLCMYMLKEIFNLNKTLIGRIFDCKHTTVIHAISNIEEKAKTDLKLQESINKVRLKFD